MDAQPDASPSNEPVFGEPQEGNSLPSTPQPAPLPSIDNYSIFPSALVPESTLSPFDDGSDPVFNEPMEDRSLPSTPQLAPLPSTPSTDNYSILLSALVPESTTSPFDGGNDPVSGEPMEDRSLPSTPQPALLPPIDTSSVFPSALVPESAPSPSDGANVPVFGEPQDDRSLPSTPQDAQLPPVNDFGVSSSAPELELAPPQLPSPFSNDSFAGADTRASTPMAADILSRPLPFFMSNRDSLASNLDSAPAASATPSFVMQSPLIPVGAGKSETSESQDEPASQPLHPKRLITRKKLLAILFSVIALAIILAVVLGVYFGVVKRKPQNTSSASSSGPQATGASSSSAPRPSGAPPKGKLVIGRDGSQVTTEDGTAFTYKNKFGGIFVVDPTNPFNNAAQAQSWSPPLNQSWQWGKDQVLGVNLGGWLVLEPFITPALFQKYPGTVDEWTLSEAMAADTASGGLGQLEDHYKNFVTEQDFAEIAGAGLNWIRLPIPYWAIETWPGEPFLAKVSWKYALKAFEWARKYGLRICLDLHTAPGSQNGYNHSGQYGQVNFLNGVMGIANAQRLLGYIRIFTEFISQPQYKDVVPMFGILNEPTSPVAAVQSFYLEAHRLIRGITGFGAGNGPFISIHDHFLGTDDWAGFLTGSDRIALELHPYFAFNGQGAQDVAPYIPQPCSAWGPSMNTSQTAFGVTTAGEWSLGFNDCGLFLHGTVDTHTTANCDVWDDWENYTPAMKQNLMNFAKASMDSLQQYFFWTWKIGPGAVVNKPRSPLWSYKLGLENGWIPENPRDAIGFCASLGVTQSTPFDGTYLPWQVGGAGAGQISAADRTRFGTWPPAAIGLFDDAAALPTYTATGAVATLPAQTAFFVGGAVPTGVVPTVTVDAAAAGSGWANPRDDAPGVVPVAGCVYPDPWDATAVAVPPVCPAGATAPARTTKTTKTTTTTSPAVVAATTTSTTSTTAATTTTSTTAAAAAATTTTATAAAAPATDAARKREPFLLPPQFVQELKHG